MNFPTFPDYINLSELPELFVNFNVGNLKPYSDFTFSNMWSWNLDKSFKVSELNGNVVVFLRDHRTKEFFLSINGLNNVNESVEILITESVKFGLSTKLNFVPEETAILLDTKKFEILEDRDSFDYVYKISNLIDLSGKSLKTKRQLCNFFEKNYSNIRFEESNITETVKIKILDFISAENSRRTKLGYTPFAEYEMAALENFLTLPENKYIYAFFLIVNEEIVGCSIDELLPNNFALSHFFKASISLKGSYDFLNRKTAIKLKEFGCDHWNWVEDSGIDGLRQAKLSYRPEYLLKKYSVSKK